MGRRLSRAWNNVWFDCGVGWLYHHGFGLVASSRRRRLTRLGKSSAPPEVPLLRETVGLVRARKGLRGEVQLISHSGYRAAFLLTCADGARYVVKGHRSRQSFDREQTSSYAAHGMGVGPRVEWSYAGWEHPFAIVYEYLSGSPLSPVDPDEDWRAAGEAVRSLHNVKMRDGLPRFEEMNGSWLEFCDVVLFGDTRRAAQAGWMSFGTAHDLRMAGTERLAEVDEPPRTFLHGDLLFEHVLVRPESARDPSTILDSRVKLVGYSHSGCGDAAWDLVVLTQWDPARLPVVLDGYRASPKFAKHVRQVEVPYRIMRHLGEARRAAARGEDPLPETERALQLISASHI